MSDRWMGERCAVAGRVVLAVGRIHAAPDLIGPIGGIAERQPANVICRR